MARLTTDSAIVVLAMFAAQLVRFGPDRPGIALGVVETTYAGLSTLISIAWIISLSLAGAHSTWPRQMNGLTYRPLIMATFAVFGLLSIATLVLQLEISRGYLAVALPIGTLLLLLTRWWARQKLKRARRRGEAHSRAILVGDLVEAARLAEILRTRTDIGVDVVGVVPPHGGPEPHLHIAAEAARLKADLVVTVGDVRDLQLRKLLWSLEHTSSVVWVSVDLPELAAPRATFQAIDGLPVLELAPANRTMPRLYVKRVFDVAFSVSALIVTAPFIGIFAALIKLTSSGPVLFRQERVGIDGHHFSIVKLRSMRQGAEDEVKQLSHLNEADGPLFKIKNDPRVTSIGRFMRATSLDELPQLFNVLCGDMSMVGPRPPLPSEVEEYDGTSSRRLTVKPGLTGLWQVNGRSDLPWEQGMKLDLFYVENWTAWGDLKIILLTVRAVLRPSGAY